MAKEWRAYNNMQTGGTATTEVPGRLRRGPTPSQKELGLLGVPSGIMPTFEYLKSEGPNGHEVECCWTG